MLWQVVAEQIRFDTSGYLDSLKKSASRPTATLLRFAILDPKSSKLQFGIYFFSGPTADLTDKSHVDPSFKPPDS